MKRVRQAVLGGVIVFLATLPAFAATHVVVVATSEFASPVIPDLPHAAPTATALRTALVEHCGLSASAMRILNDADAAYPPTKTNLEKSIRDAIAAAGPEDSLVIYLCVNAVQSDDTDELRLLTSDTDPRDLEATSVATSWVRQQLDACKAGRKLVLLDTCYVGRKKSPDSIEPADAMSVANTLLNAPDSAQPSTTVVIASASPQQQSGPLQQGTDASPSLFSYWVAKAFSGQADQNRDQHVSAREVYDFVSGNVERTSLLTAGENNRQTPVLVNAKQARQNVLAVVPVEFRKSVRDAAEALSWTLLAQNESKPRIAVMPFVTEYNTETLVNGPFGALSNSGSVDVASTLDVVFRKQKRSVETLSGARLSKLLTELNFGAQDFRDSKRVTALAARANVNAIVKGQIKGVNDKNQITFVLQAVDANGREIGEPVEAVSHASANSIAMCGASFDTRLVHAQVRRDLLTNSLTIVDDAVTALPALDERRIVANRITTMPRETHPLEALDFPFRVWLEVNGKRRPIDYVGNDAFVTVPRHATFEVHVENQSGDQVMMRLLVDGFNSLPQDGESMPQVHLDDARPWIVAPGFHARVPGFVSRTGTAGEYAEFLVVDASRSLAARRQFTQQLGLITAAFYRPKASQRGVGVTPGAIKQADFTVTKGFVPGDLLGVVQLRYQEASE